MNIQDKMRISNVKRWHIVNTSKEQTLADHTCRVAILAHEIAKRLNILNQYNEALIYHRAINHDISEVVGGDMPGNTKNKISDERIPENDIEKVIKLADVLETYVFIREHYVDRHGKEVAHWCAQRWSNLIRQTPALEMSALTQLECEIMEGSYFHA
jgi:5'-deoxynucleotidase YfbR-like HD superfamily hydrolase